MVVTDTWISKSMGLTMY